MRTMTPRVTRCFGSSVLSPAFHAARRICALLGAPILIALTIGLSPAPASAQCLQTAYKDAGNNQKLNCTAGDVKVASVQGVTVVEGGTGDQCYEGGSFDFIADFNIVTTSNKTRSNIGIYFGTGSGSDQNGALTGVCTDDVLSPTYTKTIGQCVNGTCTVGNVGLDCSSDATVCNKVVHYGDSGYEELDSGEACYGDAPGTCSASPAGCGDTSSSDSNNTGIQTASLEVDGVTCPSVADTVTCPPGTDGSVTTCMLLPVCTSWQIPGKSTFCQATGPDYTYQSTLAGTPPVPTAIPGSPSKCSCGLLYVPVQPISVSASVVKSCSTQGGAITSTTKCDAGVGDVSGGAPVTYTATIKNPSTDSNIVVDQICDSAYGNIYTASGYSGSACPAGSQCAAPNNNPGDTCATAGSSPCDSLGTIDANNGTASCTFDVNQPEDLQVTDTLTIAGHSTRVTTATFSGVTSNQVEVDTGESPSTATITGSAPYSEGACATVRYEVDAANTSGADENLTLNSLSDSVYGNVTQCTNTDCANTGPTAQILGTTCGVEAGSLGLGSLHAYTVVGPGTTPGTGEMPGGALPASLSVGGSDYVCYFDAQFCHALDANQCISQTEHVNGSIGGDESETTDGVCDTTTTHLCTAGNVGATCTQNSDCDTVTETFNTFNVKECLGLTVTQQ